MFAPFSCVCSSFGLAFTIYSTAGDQVKVWSIFLVSVMNILFFCQATYCLMKQGRVLSSLNYATKMKVTTPGILLAVLTLTGHKHVTDFAKILYSHPSIKLAKLMIEPPAPHEPKLTLIMVITLTIVLSYYCHPYRLCIFY